MKSVHKILCCCISGLGSSFIMEMNLKKALKNMGLTDIEIEHAGLNDAYKGAADLFICSADIYDICKKAGDTIPIEVLTNASEYEAKLREYFKVE